MLVQQMVETLSKIHLSQGVSIALGVTIKLFIRMAREARPNITKQAVKVVFLNTVNKSFDEEVVEWL